MTRWIVLWRFHPPGYAEPLMVARAVEAESAELAALSVQKTTNVLVVSLDGCEAFTVRQDVSWSATAGDVFPFDDDGG